jgi:ubiquinone/menaquinone biosynthesis C-methylase UbiE
MSMQTTVITHNARVRDQWDRLARGWSDSSAVIRPWLRDTTDAMIAMAGIAEDSRVLDVAAGAGDQTVDIAERVGPSGSVLATDISAEILRFAQQRAAAAGHANVRTLVCDGEQLDVEEASFDAVVCRLGLMFFADPLRGLQGIRRALRPGGRLCTMVFSSPQANPCVAILMSTALRHAGLPMPEPYQPGGLLSLGKPGLLDNLFRAAGFHQVATTAMAAPFKLPSAKHYLDFIKASAAPVVEILQRLEPAQRDAAWIDIEAKLSQFNTPSGWEGPNELLLTAARR